MQLGPMLSEFIAFFAELASALIHSLLSESTSLLQQALKESKEGFPKAGEKPQLGENWRRAIYIYIYMYTV